MRKTIKKVEQRREKVTKIVKRKREMRVKKTKMKKKMAKRCQTLWSWNRSRKRTAKMSIHPKGPRVVEEVMLPRTSKIYRRQVKVVSLGIIKVPLKSKKKRDWIQRNKML